MSSDPCIHCQGVFPTSEHACGARMALSLEERVGEHEKTEKELALALQGVASAAQDILRLERVEQRLNEELMKRDTAPDFERGEFAGQDAMLVHIGKLTETSNSQLAAAVRACQPFKDRAEVLRQVAENLECASYKTGEKYDPEAAKAFHFALGICQARAERLQGVKDDGWDQTR